MASLPKIVLSPEAVYYYTDHPCEFVEDNILEPMSRRGGAKIAMTTQQRALMMAVSKYNRVGVESGHGTGKSAALSWIAAWFLATRHNSLGQKVKVPCIAPTYHQLYDVLWPEFKTWLPQSRIYPLYEIAASEVYIVGYKDMSYIRARSPKEPDNLQGFHAPHLLWICDEAFGITNTAVWEMIEGSLTQDDNRILFGGQHTAVSGYCHDAFHSDRADWRTLRFSSEDSPIALKSFAERIERRYGRHSDVFRVRVLGQEPKGNPDAYIQLVRVEAARNREVRPKGAIQMGIDPARFGDDLTVVTAAQGLHVFPQIFLERSDTYEIYDLAIQFVRRLRKQQGYNGVIEIRIDCTGGYGAGVFDMLLRNTTDNVMPIAINFGGAGDDEYADIVSAMWGSLEQQIDMVELPQCEFLTEELSTRRYKLDKHGRVQIEPKSEYKKEYHSSPDRSDSLVMCLYTKTWKKRVWEYFTRESMVNMSIRWDDQRQAAHNLHYGAVVVGKDMRVVVVCAMWDQRSKMLYIYDAWSTSQVIPIGLAANLIVRMHLKDFLCNKLLGNELVFEMDGSKPIARQINDVIMRAGVDTKIRLATRHDKYGSIVDVNQMMRLGRVLIDKKLDDMASEIQGWTIDKDSPEEGALYCEALCMISGELKVGRELDNLKPVMKDYARESTVKAVYES